MRSNSGRARKGQIHSATQSLTLQASLLLFPPRLPLEGQGVPFTGRETLALTIDLN